MKTMLCCAFFLLVILSGATLNPLFAADEQREAYDRMVEEATREADEFVEQKQKEQHEAAQQGKKRANPEADEPVQAERKQIEAEMERVRERGLGPNYTEGMRDNQLQELEKKLDQLDSRSPSVHQNTCWFSAPQQNDVWVIVYDADVDGNRGGVIWQGKIAAGQKIKIKSTDGHIRYDYKLDPDQPYEGEVSVGCFGQHRISVD